MLYGRHYSTHSTARLDSWQRAMLVGSVLCFLTPQNAWATAGERPTLASAAAAVERPKPNTATDTVPAAVAPQGLFYRGQDYGSESQFNPLTVLLNGGLDILKSYSWDSRLDRLPIAAGAENVWRNLAHPNLAIDDVGWDHFVSHEIFPYRGLQLENAQWMANWSLHFLGEGMLYRKTAEWYAAHEVPFPRLMALATVMTMQFVNEVVENGRYRDFNVDPVADFYFFNPLGFLMFSIDRFAALFAGPIRSNFWPGQAVIDLRQGVLFNHGENYSFKISLGSWTDWRAFAYVTNYALFGLSVPVGGGNSLSFGAGPYVLELKVDDGGEGRTIIPGSEMNLNLGVFWDRDESLLASLIVGGINEVYALLNVYPGAFNTGDLALGFYVMASSYEGFAVGLTVSDLPAVPGILLGNHFHRAHF